MKLLKLFFGIIHLFALTEDLHFIKHWRRKKTKLVTNINHSSEKKNELLTRCNVRELNRTSSA